jgi:TATA-box binding protein (TBP) (component of TFIID and TFIIIB)
MINSSFNINKNYNTNLINWNLPCFDVHNTISNIVGLAKFNCSLNLQLIHKFFPNSAFDPSKIPCVRCPLNITNFNAVALIYSSGSVIITGLNHLSLIHHAFFIIKAFLKKTHSDLFILDNFNFKIHNVVSAFNTKHKINLNLLPFINNLFFFDPQEFPAAQFHAHNFINIHATVLIYFNGKIIVTGAKHIHLGITLA